MYIRFELPDGVTKTGDRFAAAVNTLEPNAWMNRVSHSIQAERVCIGKFVVIHGSHTN